MAYIGTAPAEAYSATAVKDSFNGDGSTVAFTMSQPSKTNDVRVVVENVIQDPTVAYSCSGTTITFTSAPPSGTANVYVVHLGLPVQSIVPPADINIATTYTTDLTVQGAFTSQGIDDNANATAITIDSSERVLIGHTTANGYALDVAKANLGAAGFNRTGTDGEIAAFMKDGTTVGSIGVLSSRLSIGTGDTGLFFNDQTDQVQPFNTSTNAARDAAIDLGTTDRRFKDLYLSGGVYVGGTGSANYLDDYEEGTWTPTWSRASSNPTGITYNHNTGSYTKIGNKVFIQGAIYLATWSGGSGYYQIEGLPFTSTSGSAHDYSQILMTDVGNYSLSGGSTIVGAFSSQNGTYLGLMGVGGGYASSTGNFTPTGTFYVYFSGFYTTNS